MELTGKCKEDFEEWMEYTHLNRNTNFFNSGLTPDSFRWGVLVDFFDSVDIYIVVGLFDHNNWQFEILQDTTWKIDFETRTEARKEAIKKANDIYNSK
tara:strand:+ start:44 stop:337 length:294 start_codon:yes stop_codon:yes gene_type:complete